ncbi:uncharacterized protein [Asterias amurensis]|uniref:uncharacterized protein isoform X1 n=1 Tax=Asterias amurensis TaxID=7602 RepID=UPI003AB23A50
MKEFRFQTLKSHKGGCRLRCGAWIIICLVVVSALAQTNAPGHLGCFVDERNRALKGGSRTFDPLSVQRCFKHCQDDLHVDYTYAGLEYAEECYCGNNENYGRHGRGKESDCEKYTCTGDSDQFCGGSWRIAIYKISQGVCSNAIGPPAHGTNSITNPSGLSYNLDNYKFLGTEVNFFCDAGYVLDGSSTIMCLVQENTVGWSDTVPTCRAVIPSTIPTTTVPTTTTTAPSTGKITTTNASRAPPSSTEAASTKSQQTLTLDKGSLIGIVIGVLLAVIIGLAFIIFICRKRRSKRKASPSAVATDTMGMSFSNNMYEITVQTTERDPQEPNQNPQAQLYSEVIRKQSRSGESNYVNAVIQPSSGAHENAGTGLVDNVLYESSSFRDEPDMAGNDSEMAGNDSNGRYESFTTAKENPGWV